MLEYQLRKCDRCKNLWITDGYAISEKNYNNSHYQQTVTCPICQKEHDVHSLKIVDSSEDIDALRESRSLRLADDAGEYEVRYENEDDYLTQEQNAKKYLAKLGYDVGEQTVSGWEPIGESAFKKEREEYESQRGSKFRSLADVVLGDIGREEYAVPKDADLHWSPVSLGVDRSDKTDIPIDEYDNTGSLTFRPDNGTLRDTEVETSEVLTASELYYELFCEHSEFNEAIVLSIKELSRRVNHDITEFWRLTESLSDHENFVGSNGVIDLMAAQIAKEVGRETNHIEESFLNVIEGIWDDSSIVTRSGIQDIADGPLKFLRATSITPEITVTLGRELYTKPIQTRKNLVTFLTELARGCSVTVRATPRLQRQIWMDYEDELPDDVNLSQNPHRSHENPELTPKRDAQSLVEVDIKPNSNQSRVLRILSEGRTDSGYYGVSSDLVNDPRLDVSRSRISQIINELEEYGCLNTHDGEKKYATLTEVGSCVIDELHRSAGRQIGLDDAEDWGKQPDVSPTLNSNADTCCHNVARERDNVDNPTIDSDEASSTPSSAQATVEPVDDGGRNHSDGLSTIDYLFRYEHESLFAAAPDGGIVLDNVELSTVNRNDQFDDFLLEAAEDNRNPKYSYNSEREELVVGAQYHTPYQLGLTLMRAMTCEDALRNILTPDRLDADDVELGGLLRGHKQVLRDISCLGWLKDEYDAEGYRDRLREAKKEILQKAKQEKKMRRQRANGNSDSNPEEHRNLRKEVMRACHGLIGTMTAIYDYLGVDLHRTIRIPGEGYHNLDQGEPGVPQSSASVSGLCHWLVRASTIASTFGAYRQSRQQFEDRPEKREMDVEVPGPDRSEAIGSHIGSWSIVGHDVDKLQSDIQWALENPEEYDLELQVDEPNYVNWLVRIPIKTEFTRDDAYRVTTRMLADRDLTETRIAVSLLHAFVDSPHDIGYGIHRLSSEDGREVRLSEIRRSLAELPAHRIFSTSSSSTKSKVLHTLLSANQPLSQSELCDKAGVSTASFAGHGSLQSHRDQLEAFGLIVETDSGWVISLPYSNHRINTKEGDEIIGLPWYAIVNDDRAKQKLSSTHREASVQGVIYEAIIALEDGNLSDPDHPVFEVMYGSLTEESLSRLLTARPHWERLVEFVLRIREGGLQTIGNPSYDHSVVTLRGKKTTANLGRLPSQTKLFEFTESVQTMTGKVRQN